MLKHWLVEVHRLQKLLEKEVLQEVSCRNEGVKTLKGGDFNYKLHLKDEDTPNGVRLMVKHELVKSVMDVR